MTRQELIDTLADRIEQEVFRLRPMGRLMTFGELDRITALVTEVVTEAEQDLSALLAGAPQTEAEWRGDA